jgi:guanosine-3',5'-bis(diphosphate) 3'-pyrophosphohydrolase
MNDLLAALMFAAERHRDQRRKDSVESPYINHLIAVTKLLAEVGIEDGVVLIAAALHDIVEDTATSREEIEAIFGAAVAGVVAEVTDDKTLPKERRKRAQVEHALQLSAAAKLVKIADKICNVRDVAGNPPRNWSVTRRRDYVDWAAEVVEGCRGVHAPLESVWDATLAQAREVVTR